MLSISGDGREREESVAGWRHLRDFDKRVSRPVYRFCPNKTQARVKRAGDEPERTTGRVLFSVYTMGFHFEG